MRTEVGLLTKEDGGVQFHARSSSRVLYACMKHFKYYSYTYVASHSVLIKCTEIVHSFKQPEGQVARWLQELEGYEFLVDLDIGMLRY